MGVNQPTVFHFKELKNKLSLKNVIEGYSKQFKNLEITLKMAKSIPNFRILCV